MTLMGCALCRVKRDVAQAPQSEPPRCPQHSQRVLVPWELLEHNPNDQWLGLILSDRYEITHPLGKGGFGSVYLAVQRGHIRYSVAIKLLTRQSPEYFDLFRDEMRVISRLQNPHTVRYLGSGTHRDEHSRDIPFMVMNLIEGETLAHRIIRDGSLSPNDVILVLRQLLYSLEEAHQLGIVHRDLKPLNLMINQKPNQPLNLVVLDFGVARILDEASREATRNRIMGTPYYLAPETLVDHQVTTQTDLFAAAVIAYEALCCRSPFLNEELQGIEPYLKLRKLYRAKSKPEPLPSRFSREWRLFFECALAINPEERFPDATSMLIALDELERIELEHQAIASRPSPPVVDDFEEEEVTTFFKRHLAGESVDDLELQSMSEIDSSSGLFETLNVLPPSIPPPLPPQFDAASSQQRDREKSTLPLNAHQQASLQQNINDVMREVQQSISTLNHGQLNNQSHSATSPLKKDTAEEAPTIQLARPDFSGVNLSEEPTPYSTPPVPQYTSPPVSSPNIIVGPPQRGRGPSSPDHISSPPVTPEYMTSSAHRYLEDTGRLHQASGGQSLPLMILQLFLMVGLGALFAYIMIRYVLV